MSRGTIFNNSANLFGDTDYIKCNNAQNEKLSDYQLSDLRPKSDYIQSMGEVGLYYDAANTIRSYNIDVDSYMRNGDKGNIITNNKNRIEKTLDTRPFNSMPYIGPGSGSVKTDLEDQVQRGEQTNAKRSQTEQKFSNTFIPLIPELEKAMNNVDHFVETNWVRGGISTRSVKQNIDYAKSCGLRR
jgi:hypothetical protein